MSNSMCKGFKPRQVSTLTCDGKMTVCANCGCLPHDPPPPQSADSTDEAKLEELLFALTREVYNGGKRGDGEAGYAETDAIRSFFKRAAKGGEGMVSVPRDALECFMTTIKVACQQLEGSVLQIKDPDMRGSAAEVARHYRDHAAALQSALSTKHP